MDGYIHQAEQNRNKTLAMIAQSCLKGWIWRPRSSLILLRVWCPAGSQHRPTSGGTWHHQQLLVYYMHNCHFENNRWKSVHYMQDVLFSSNNFPKFQKKKCAQKLYWHLPGVFYTIFGKCLSYRVLFNCSSPKNDQVPNYIKNPIKKVSKRPEGLAV